MPVTKSKYIFVMDTLIHNERWTSRFEKAKAINESCMRTEFSPAAAVEYKFSFNKRLSHV